MQAYSPQWSVLRVTGPDAASFLHNLCTNEIKKLPAGACCEAFFTDVKGKVLASALVCHLGEGHAADGYAVVVTSPHAADLAAHLEKYHIREELEITVDAESNLSLFWGGPPAADELFEVAALGARLCLNDACMDTMVRLGPGGFDTLRIERGFPLDRVDIDSSRLPQEVNRDAAAISFTKGCYLGQETVARIDALGHVNRLLVSLKFAAADPPSVGAELTADGKSVGVVTSACYSKEIAAPLALAYVRREQSAAGTKLESSAGVAEVLPGPAVSDA